MHSPKVLAVTMLLSGAVVATGAALEFAYFGPGSPQFLAGLVATPAGLAGVAGGFALWRRGRRARRLVIAAALILLAGTAVATALGVMGPPATLVGVIGGLPPFLWAWTQRGVDRDQRNDSDR